MSTALQRAKEKAAEIRAKATARARRAREENQKLIVAGVGELGAAVSAGVCGIVDAKAGSEGAQAKFGTTEIPIAPVVGIVAMGAGALMQSSSPEIGAFLFRGGAFPVDLAIYNFARDKTLEWDQD